jgi:hypothetical protein
MDQLLPDVLAIPSQTATARRCQVPEDQLRTEVPDVAPSTGRVQFGHSLPLGPFVQSPIRQPGGRAGFRQPTAGAAREGLP